MLVFIINVNKLYKFFIISQLKFKFAEEYEPTKGDGNLVIFDKINQETFQSLKTHPENILRIKSGLRSICLQ